MTQKAQIRRLLHRTGEIVEELQTFHFQHSARSAKGWQPLINAYRYPAHYELCAELAGVESDDVKVEVNGSTITISGTRKWPELRCVKTGSRCHRTTLMEIQDGPFWRQMDLPDEIDADSVELQFLNGLLWIRLPVK